MSVFGSQCIVVSIDIKKDYSGKYVLFSSSRKDIKFSIEECLRLLIDFKAGEVLLNNVDLDGIMTGYDLDLMKYVSSRVNIPVIAAGGASNPEDCVKAVKAGALAVAASMFHFTSVTPRMCKEVMANAGIPARI